MGITIAKLIGKKAYDIRKKELEKIENRGFEESLLGAFGLVRSETEREKTIYSTIARGIAEAPTYVRDDIVENSDKKIPDELLESFFSSEPREQRKTGFLKKLLLGKKNVDKARMLGESKAVMSVLNEETPELNERQQRFFSNLSDIFSQEVQRKQIRTFQGKNQYEGLI